MFTRYCIKTTAVLAVGVGVKALINTSDNEEKPCQNVENPPKSNNYVFIDDTVIPFREVEEDKSNTPKF